MRRMKTDRCCWALKIKRIYFLLIAFFHRTKRMAPQCTTSVIIIIAYNMYLKRIRVFISIGTWLEHNKQKERQSTFFSGYERFKYNKMTTLSTYPPTLFSFVCSIHEVFRPITSCHKNYLQHLQDCPWIYLYSFSTTSSYNGSILNGCAFAANTDKDSLAVICAPTWWWWAWWCDAAAG